MLHFGPTSSAGIAVSIAAVFLGIFAFSFAFGSIPKGGRRFSRKWTLTWLRASLPRIAIAAAFSAAVYVGSTLGSGNTSNGASSATACDQGIPALSNNPVTSDRLKLAIDQTRGAALAAGTRDVSAARGHFFGTAHDLTHDIDPPLRGVNAPLATELCKSVISLENHLLGIPETNAASIAAEAQACADQLTRAGEALGLQT